jgi:hypothetical protein
MFADWLNQHAYVGRGTNEGTIEEAVLYFFYEGLNPFIKSLGYTWSNKQDIVIARKFLYLCYMIQTTPRDKDLIIPGPKHRDYQYDRDTFEFVLDTFTFNDFLENWLFCHEVCGTRFDYLIKDFCYSWIDVTSGNPGKMTQKMLDADSEEQEAITQEFDITESYSRRNWSLY